MAALRDDLDGTLGVCQIRGSCALGIIVAASRAGALLVTGVLACGLLSAAPSAGSWSVRPTASGEVTEVDWVVGRADSDVVATIESQLRVFGHRTDTGPLVIGIGFAHLGPAVRETRTSVRRFGGGPTIASLVIGPAPGEVDLVVTVEEDGSFALSARDWTQGAKTVATLVFVVNGAIDAIRWGVVDVAPAAAHVVATTRTGKGARAVHLSEVGDGTNTAMGVGSAAVGQSESSHLVESGIVGAMERYSCHVCQGTWTAPDGASGEWKNIKYEDHGVCACWVGLNPGTSWFAGPAGQWQFGWAGFTAGSPLELDDSAAHLLSRPVVAAWAPVGEDWLLFRP